MADTQGMTIEKLKAANPGLRRSLEVYYGNTNRDRAMDALNLRFVSQGELALDIGSHVGDRIGSFRRLGARVVAVEPQPDCAAAIRAIYRHDDAVHILEAACASKPEKLTFSINTANPTVSTASKAFVAAADGAKGWEEQVWDRQISVPATTLDAIIADHGPPAFAKIDVEGFEDAVLAGLSQPIPALSFEFTTIGRDVAYRCLDRLAELGPYLFDVALGESHELTFGDGHEIAAGAMSAHINALPYEANSGDIYAILQA